VTTGGRRRARAAAALLIGVGLVAGVGATAASAGSAGTVHLRTAPAMAGVHLVVGSTAVTTGADGTADVQVADLNNIAAKVSLASSKVDQRTTVALATVRPEPHSVVHESTLVVGLDVSNAVTIRVLPGRTGVAPGSVSRVRLHSVTGASVVVDPRHHPTVMLLARKSRLVRGIPTPQVVTWTVDSVGAAPGVALTSRRDHVDPLATRVWPLLLRPVAGQVSVDTVPVTAGVMVSLDGASAVTDRHGRATIPAPDLNGVVTRVHAAGATTDGAQVAVLRVSTVAARAAHQRHIVLALAVSTRVSFAFVDPVGAPVASSRISSLQLSSAGHTVDIAGADVGDGLLLVTQKAHRDKGRWTASPVAYSVAKVTVDGAEAVFAGQQRYTTAHTSDWTVRLSVFDVSVDVRDVLFGSSIDSAADVTRPDASTYPVQLTAAEPTVLHALVRGEYVLTAHAAAVGAGTRLLVSRDQAVQIRVITRLDVAVVVALLVGLCLSLVWVGRAWSRRHSGRVDA
jgi:hypothetical protein